MPYGMSSRQEGETVRLPLLQKFRVHCAARALGLRTACALALLLLALPARAGEAPSWLPRYDLTIRLDVAAHQVFVRERVTWTNMQPRPTSKIVFNDHAHYTIPAKDVGLFAKLLELLRLAPSEVFFDFEGPALEVHRVSAAASGAPLTGTIELPFRFQPDSDTALEITLPAALPQGQSVTLDLEFTLRLPQKQGRWGQWRGVTTLAQWLPVVAVYDAQGWQPTPFIPWHLPFFNEAGIYTAHITLPADQKLGSTGRVVAERTLGDGWREVEVQSGPVRDFSLFCSARFHEELGLASGVLVRCLALPEHEFYAKQIVQDVCEALPVYEQWFGPYPYPEFTVVESYFGWNGNQCGGLVMIDERIFGLPHMAHAYVDMLVSHELSHQWWYNVVGINGYAETWMAEGLAVWFSHHLMDQKYGKNNHLLDWPKGFRWLPNIRRDDYRYYCLAGVVARGEEMPTVQNMEKFQHLVNLSAMTYDRGGKIVGMIEDRLGEAAFFDFMRQVYRRYYFRILRVEDYRRELEAYTGRSWKEFFQNWLYGKGMTDWAVDKVEVQAVSEANDARFHCLLPVARCSESAAGCRVVVYLRQYGDILEQTVLGFCLDDSARFQVRIPIVPEAPVLEMDNPPARVEFLDDGRVRVEVVLPHAPTQIVVDPDNVLVDRNPANNRWKRPLRTRFTPLYFDLDETDLTNAYDRLNFICGPWVYGATYDDPWYTRSPMIGLRAGVYSTQEFSGGAYVAYRSDDRNVVTGVDGLIDHWPWGHTQVGFNYERSLVTLSNEDTPYSRGVIYGRYVFNYSSSLYLPPIDYVEVFGAEQTRDLPLPRYPTPGADLFGTQSLGGIHYHLDYLTPYWDPEGGFALDVTYEEGAPIFGEPQELHMTNGQISAVTMMPDWLARACEVPGLRWLSESRVAGRLYGAAALPNNAEVFTLGGGEQFRGFDLSERQGNLIWLASVEWRVPLVRGVTWDCCDHVAGIRNIYGAAFYDVGNAYLNGHPSGPIAHAVGGGLRLDVAWFSFIERTILRFDVAKTINSSAPVQFWFGVRQPF
jgi:hypothetical protein